MALSFLTFLAILSSSVLGAPWWCCTTDHDDGSSGPRIIQPSSSAVVPEWSPSSPPPDMSIGNLSPSKTLESLGKYKQQPSDWWLGELAPGSSRIQRFLSPPKRRGSPLRVGSEEDLELARLTMNCWHECVFKGGYFYSKSRKGTKGAIPLTNGLAVKSQNPRARDVKCLCKLSPEVIEILNSAEQSLEKFQLEMEQINESAVRAFLKEKGMKFISYEELHKKAYKSFKRNKVPLDVDTASERNPHSPC